MAQHTLATMRGRGRQRTALRRSAAAALGLLATAQVHAQQGEIRTRIAASDGDATYYGVRCPDGSPTRVVVRAPAPDSALTVCFRPRASLERCLPNASVIEAATAACADLQQTDGTPTN